MKSLIKKFIPNSVLRGYHRAMAKAADFWYGHPSGKMIVIGVTGTKGKSTTCYLIAKILEEALQNSLAANLGGQAGYKVGMTSTAMFKVGEREWINPYKMTMLGRFKLQKLLAQMVRAGCRYAIVETSSEGILQSRHCAIDYDVAVFTNLAPEHIETHGSFEKYKAAKGELFNKLKVKSANRRTKVKTIDGKEVKKIIIVNGDDESAEWFLQFSADEKIAYGIKSEIRNPKSETNSKFQIQNSKNFEAINVKEMATGVSFVVNNIQFNLGLLGRFNVYNALAAVAVARSQGIDLETCKQAMEKIKSIPGRLEPIDEGQSFKVFVDYAHNPSSFEALYKAIEVVPHNRIIHVFGATGGGRDKSKRPLMGKIAAEKADVVIVTTDDPYEENPVGIIEQVRVGVTDYALKSKNKELFEIIDRREAIKKAIELARDGDVILITGKGCEQKMAIGGKMIPWDDREVAREALRSK